MRRTIQIQIDENQRNCIVSGMILLILDMNQSTKKENISKEQKEHLENQIQMLDRMIDDLNLFFK